MPEAYHGSHGSLIDLPCLVQVEQFQQAIFIPSLQFLTSLWQAQTTLRAGAQLPLHTDGTPKASEGSVNSKERCWLCSLCSAPQLQILFGADCCSQQHAAADSLPTVIPR